MSIRSTQLALYGRRLWPPFALAVLLVVTWALVDAFGGTTYEAYGVRMFLNLMVVLALQIFSGNSGVLSFGHATFVAMGAYFSALLTIPPDQKTFQFLTMPHWLSSGNPEDPTGGANRFRVADPEQPLIGTSTGTWSGFAITWHWNLTPQD